MVLFCAIAVVAYQYLFVQPKSDLNIEKVKDELELTMRFENYQKATARLLERPTFSAEWEEELWLAVQGASEINAEDQWLAKIKPLIIEEYRREIAEHIEKNAMARAEQLMLNAEQRYASGLGKLDAQQRLISAYKTRLEGYRQEIKILLSNASFSDDWEGRLWSQVEAVREMLEPENEWLIQAEQSIFDRYIEQISRDMEQGDLDQAQALIENAKSYAQHAEDQQRLDAQRLAIAEKQQRDQDKAAEESKAAIRSQFNTELTSINGQLAACRSNFNMPGFSKAVKKLKSIDLSRYRAEEPSIINALSSCIKKINISDPARAELYKKSAMSIFPSNRTIALLKMDPCDSSLAGLGGRRKGGICRDAIPNVGSGPSMVVVPSTRSIKGFAIGKYEVSIKEINQFCQTTASCKRIHSADSTMPATNIPVTTAESYLQWLSGKTKRQYRLPTTAEWTYAAQAGSAELSSKRWCLLKSRGMYMGGALIRRTQGEQNAWGLVNHVGNASEWVRNNNGALAAVGGSYNTPMRQCNFETRKNHNGAKDAEVGFRVLREIPSM